MFIHVLSKTIRVGSFRGDGIAQRVGESGARIPAGARDFLFFEAVKTSSEVHKVSFTVVTVVVSRG